MAALFKTVFAAFLLLFVLVSAKFELEHHLAPTTSGLHGAMLQSSPDILLLGSSHTRQSYDLAQLEHITGRCAFAVAYDGLDPVSMLPLLRTLLSDPAKRPKLLVLEANSAILAREPNLQDPRLFFDAPPAAKWGLLHAYLQAHPGRQAYLDMWVLASNRGTELILTYPLVSRALDRLSYNGGYASKEVLGLSSAGFSGQRIPIKSSVANVDEVAAVRAILNLVREAGMKTVFADPPMPASVEAQPEVIAIQAQYRALATALGVPYYAGADQFPTGDPGLFHDSNHVSTAGRALYTAHFAEFLRGQ